MKNILYPIKHWLQTKIYHAVLNIQNEREIATNISLISSFQSIGKNPHFGSGTKFGGMENITIGDDFQCGDDSWIYTLNQYRGQLFCPQLVIGNNVNIVNRCHVACIESIEIGDGTLIASEVFIGDHTHGSVTAADINLFPLNRPLLSKAIKIGENCWLGEHVSILPGVCLGNNVVVGANTVVTHSFPSNVVIAGCPAKVIKKLQNDK